MGAAQGLGAPSSTTAGFSHGNTTTTRSDNRNSLSKGLGGESSSIRELPQTLLAACGQAGLMPILLCQCENAEGLNVLGSVALPAELLPHRPGRITAEIDFSTDLGRVLLPLWLVYKT